MFHDCNLSRDIKLRLKSDYVTKNKKATLSESLTTLTENNMYTFKKILSMQFEISIRIEFAK